MTLKNRKEFNEKLDSLFSEAIRSKLNPFDIISQTALTMVGLSETLKRMPITDWKTEQPNQK